LKRNYKGARVVKKKERRNQKHKEGVRGKKEAHSTTKTFINNKSREARALIADGLKRGKTEASRGCSSSGMSTEPRKTIFTERPCLGGKGIKASFGRFHVYISKVCHWGEFKKQKSW